MKRAVRFVVPAAALLLLASWAFLPQDPGGAAPRYRAYHDLLASHLGAKCSVYSQDGALRLIIDSKLNSVITHVGDDFAEITEQDGIRYLPIPRLETVVYK